MKISLDDPAFERDLTLRDAYRIMEAFLAEYLRRGDTSISDFLYVYAGLTEGGWATDPAALRDFLQIAQCTLMAMGRGTSDDEWRDSLPNERQRKELGMLIQQAFVDLRTLSGEQAQDLAYAFHNLPAEIYGWGTWSIRGTRGRLRHYQSKHSSNLGFDYVKAFNEIFPEVNP